ncbi:MAG: radical SAM protein [Candidatus Lokiarchaeota archaeon]|nr:radical SAM protein [Candidatus Lokiarchaeota archaeon]
MSLNESSILRALTLDNVRRGLKIGYMMFKSSIKHIPLSANYEITYKCNLNCEHCYFNKAVKEKLEQGIPTTELTDKQWIKNFKYHRSLGVRSAALTGGEPTLRMKLLFEANKIFDFIQIATNGVIKMPKFPGKQPVIWNSLDGAAETHNKIRGAKIFDRVISNIQDDKRIYIISSISSSNYNEIDEIAKISYDANVAGLFLIFYTGYPKDPLLLNPKQWRKAIQRISKVKEDYGDFVIITKKMLETYITKAHVKDCGFKNGSAASYFPNGEKKYCVMGNSPALCANCGCVVPVISHCLSKFDPETIELMKNVPF